MRFQTGAFAASSSVLAKKHQTPFQEKQQSIPRSVEPEKTGCAAPKAQETTVGGGGRMEVGTDLNNPIFEIGSITGYSPSPCHIGIRPVLLTQSKPCCHLIVLHSVFDINKTVV